MNSNDPWIELNRRAAQFPRYSRVYGVCPACGQGSTRLQAFVTVWYCVCDPCQTRWRSDVQHLSTALDPDDRPELGGDEEDLEQVKEELQYQNLLDLARCQELSPLPHLSRSRVSMKTKPTESAPLFDLWAGALAAGTKANNDRADPTAPPSQWADLSPDTCARLSCVLLEGDPPGLLLGAHRRLRARWMPAEDMAEPPAHTAALASYFVADYEERSKWQRAEAELMALSVGIMLLETASHKLHAGDGLLTVLRRQRDALDAQIARLEGRHALASR